MDNEAAKDELLEAIHKGFQGVQEQLNEVQSQIHGLDGRVNGLDSRIGIVADRISGLHGRLERVETNMVTRDFLERRLAKTDGKINSLVNVLEKKKVITNEEKQKIHLVV